MRLVPAQVIESIYATSESLEPRSVNPALESKPTDENFSGHIPHNYHYRGKKTV